MPKLSPAAALRRLIGLDPFPQPQIIRMRHPIVLMHGFGYLASIGRKGHMHRFALLLRQYGLSAFAPNVAPYDTIEGRCDQWLDRLEHILEITGAEKLHLIAHSMGGLDARHLISRCGLAPHVASLTTIATPHRGFYLREALPAPVNALRRQMAPLADWIGRNALPDSDSHFLAALDQMRPEYMEEKFNPATPDADSVAYFSWAGKAGRGTDIPINPFLRYVNQGIYEREGVNDGYISVRSARWGTFMGTLEADHAAQIAVGRLSSPFDADSFYIYVARQLQELESASPPRLHRTAHR